MLLAAAGLLVWLRMAVQLRPRWQREKELNENRKKGMPVGGPATIVVTDIEKYSGMSCRALPWCTALLVYCLVILPCGTALLVYCPVGVLSC